MFKAKSKLDINLIEALKNNPYEKYRVMIKCKTLFSTILKKVASFKDALIYEIEYCNIVVANLSKREITLLIEYPEVEKIFFDEYLFLCGVSVASANKFYKSNSNFKFDGSGVKIGIIDSGVYPHLDLTRPTNKILEFKDVTYGITHPYDDNGHGTAMAGVICSSGISSGDLYSGIAKNANIISYKAFDALGKGYASSILYSIEDLIKKYREHNLRILCLPFEMLNSNSYILKAFQNIFEKAVSFNIVPIVPTGSINVDEKTLKGISTLKNCIVVSGVTSENTGVPYIYSSSSLSSKSKMPNFAAVCTNITTLNSDINYISEKNGTKLYPKKLDAKYKTYSGTSLSVAIVSAVCALLLQYNQTLKLDDLVSLINLSCTNDNDLPKNVVGEGIINLNKLLK
ncbi:MAG: S8 family peptidase [Clostridium sp.]